MSAHRYLLERILYSDPDLVVAEIHSVKYRHEIKQSTSQVKIDFNLKMLIYKVVDGEYVYPVVFYEFLLADILRYKHIHSREYIKTTFALKAAALNERSTAVTLSVITYSKNVTSCHK